MIALRPQWQKCVGYGFGFRQPVLVGRLAALPDAEERAKSCQELVADLLTAEGLGYRAHGSGAAEGAFGWLLAWAVALQRGAGVPVCEAPRADPLRHLSDGTVEYRVIAPYERPAAAVAVLTWLVDTVSALGSTRGAEELASVSASAAASLSDLRRSLARQGHGGVNIDRILPRAVQLRLPFGRLDGDTYIVGQGSRSRWLRSTFTDGTSVIGTKMARGKANAARVLAAHGLPVPAHRLARDEDDAVRIAMELGYPIVVKPADQDGGKGVHAGLASEELVRRCYRDAARHSRAVLVEKFHPGRDFRLTVFNGRLIKAIERIPGRVVGDGRHSIRELIEHGAADSEMRRRSAERSKALLALDAEAIELIAEVGLTPDSVPEAKRMVRLRRRANVSTGGTTRVVTSDVHPDNRRLAERAADALRLDVAGIDLLIEDISRSWYETEAVICEVNAQPQLGEGGAEGLYGEFLRELVGGDGRIPVVLVLGDTSLAEHGDSWAAAIRGTARNATAVVAGGMLFVDGVPQGPVVTDCTAQAMIALRRRDVHRVLVIAEPRDVARHGLPAADLDALVIAAGQWCVQVAGATATAMADMIGPHVRGPLLCVGSTDLGRRLRAEGLLGPDVSAPASAYGAEVGSFLANCRFDSNAWPD